jgi:hypothetical protein
MNHDETFPERRPSENGTTDRGTTGNGSSSHGPASHLGRAVQVFVYAPLGAGLSALDAAPAVVEAFVARGKAAVDRRHEQVSHQASNARSMGQFALTFGLPKVRKRAERRVAEVRSAAARLLPARGPAAAPAPHAPKPAAAPAAPATAPDERMHSAAPSLPRRVLSPVAVNGARAAAERAELPIPGYDALSASQVVERLAGLADTELAAVRNYETAHRNRRTILGKIEQLDSPSA